MPAQDETHQQSNTSMTEQVAKNPSSKTDSGASDHAAHQSEGSKGDKVEIRHHQANPGPAIPKDFNIQEEGTKEERRAKAEEMNK